MEQRAYLYVPLAGEHSGFGHLARGLSFARRCAAAGRRVDLLIKGPQENIALALRALYAEAALSPFVRIIKSVDGGAADAAAAPVYDAVFLDLKTVRRSELRRYAAFGPCVGIDAGGAARANFAYLVDTLPNEYLRSMPPNIYAPGSFVDANIPARAYQPVTCSRVLLYAPHERAGRTRVLFEACAALGIQLDVVVPAADDAASRSIINRYEPHVKAVAFSPDFSRSLAQYDCIITHFGLTAFEACAARVPRIIVNPGAYHSRLSALGGFARSFSRYAPAARLLARFARESAQFEAFCSSCEDEAKRVFFAPHADGGAKPPKDTAAHRPQFHELLWDIAERIAQQKNQQKYQQKNHQKNHQKNFMALGDPLSTSAASSASAHKQKKLRRAVFRSADKSIFKSRAGVYYQQPFTPPVSYENAYFFSQYKEQYGKTYLEDFPSICAKMRERLALIRRALSRSRRGPRQGAPLRLVDIGCAYGAMIQCAREAGYAAAGIDISEHACNYVADTFSVPVLRADIGAADFVPRSAAWNETLVQGGFFEERGGAFDAAGCFYVLEHAPFFYAALRGVKALLRKGGILALAVPNAAGISARRDKRAFFASNPTDHFSIFSPSGLSKIMAREGFAVRAARVTGHHPERFFSPASAARTRALPLLLAAAVSRAFGLGDTFELYAEKL